MSVSPDVKRPLLHRALAQAVLLVAVSVIALSSASFYVARKALINRAALHVTALTQAAADLTEQDLLSVRQIAQQTAQDPKAKHNARVLSVKNGAVSVRATTLTPKVSKQGWTKTDVSISKGTGSIIVSVSMQPLLDRLTAAADASGQSATVVFGFLQKDSLMAVPLGQADLSGAILLGAIKDELQDGLPLAQAFNEQQNARLTDDYRGTQVMAAARLLPSLGWSLQAQIDKDEVLSAVTTLALFHLLLAAGLLLVGAAAAWLFARSWTEPLRSLASRVAPLGPGHWEMSETLRTGDETALLEHVIATMAVRLKEFYEELERLVQERTDAWRKQYELDRAVLGTMEHAVLAVDAAGLITMLNPAAERLLHADAGAVTGRPVQDFLPLTAKDGLLAGDAHPVLRSMREKHSVSPEPGSAWTVTPQSGEAVSLYLVSTPLTADGNVFGAVAVFQDITKERQMEQLKSEFITLASHQLRTPLSIINWQLETLRDPATAKDATAQSLTEVEHATGRMTTIINALLQVAQLEGSALKPQQEASDLRQLLKTASDNVIDGNPRHIQFKNDTDAITLKTDPVLLQVVLENLIENAVKYSPDGGSVSVSCKAENNTVRITVFDAGVGIPQDEQRHVFEKFFRGSNVKKTSTDGTGLGLYIAKMIIEQLGGTLSFESAEGKGTTFTVTLKS